MATAIDNELQAFRAAVANGDWAGAKDSCLRFKAAAPTPTPETAEAAALAALISHETTPVEVAAHAESYRPKWIGEQIVKLGEANPVNKLAVSKHAHELRNVMARNGHAIDERVAIDAMKVLRNARAFPALVALGDRIVALGARAPEIHKLHVQGMIETGQPTAGLAALEAMLARTPTYRPEHIDGLGVAGRIHKQVYVDAFAGSGSGGPPPHLRDALAQSARRYEDSYVAAKSRDGATAADWAYPAINLVAVLMRAERDKINIYTAIKPRELAAEIIKEVGAIDKSRMSAWDFATLGEANFALGNYEQASHWLQAYALRPKTNAFELASTTRQFEEVWQLEATHQQAGQILLFLKAQLLAKEGGHIELTASERQELLSAELQSVNGARPEVYLSNDRPKSLTWFRTGLERANSVGLIKRKSDGQGFGTGFLAEGGNFIAGFSGPILVTNAHVISSLASELNDPHQPSERLDRAVVEFTNVGTTIERRTFELDRILFESPRSLLDTCLISLVNPPNDIAPAPLSTKTPDVKKTRVVVIGHPGGERETKVSLYEGGVTRFGPKGLLSDTNADGLKFLHYNNPTIGGNSGSPVFDIDDWCVIGLHHAGSSAQTVSLDQPNAAAQPFGNEGVFIQSITAASAHAPATVAIARTGTMESRGSATTPLRIMPTVQLLGGGAEANEPRRAAFWQTHGSKVMWGGLLAFGAVPLLLAFVALR
jgi:tetratricopeptide (TPR) repeat protein